MLVAIKDFVVASEGKGSYAKPLVGELLRLALPDRRIVFEDDLKADARDPDLVIRSHFFFLEPEKKYSCPYICWSGEAYPAQHRTDRAPLCELNTVLGGGTATVPSFYLPFALLQLPKDLSRVRQYDHRTRPFFCAYVASNPVPYREEVFAALRRYSRSAHGLGACSNTVGGWCAEGSWDNLFKVYTAYKFALVMENRDEEGYVTEKIVNAFIAGCIPIYWGSKGYIKKMFNPEAFIYLSDFATLADAIERAKQINESDALYNAMLDQPILASSKERIPEALDLSARRDLIALLRKNFCG